MDAVSYSLASKQAQRIERFIEDPDSTSGIVTVPKTIASGETVTVPAGRIAVLPNIVVDGTLNIDGEVFIPSGSSVDFSNGIKIDGNNIVLSIPTAYHIYNGSVEATNTVVTNGFSTTLYTGNGGTQTINTGVDMATQWGNDASEMFGGLSWIKGRTTATSHQFVDTVRGATKAILSDTNGAETTDATRLNVFNNNGFTVGTNTGVNNNTTTYASWNFQTTHRKTGVTNHGKAYTEHYNPFTGFTIIKYEGSGIAGHEIPHSLGRKLGFVTIKNLATTNDWVSSRQTGYHLSINVTSGEIASTIYITSLEENNILIGTAAHTNASTNQHILYGWANSYSDEDNTLIGNYEVGIYQGTGAAGNKILTRGKPAWIMIKRLDSTGNWNIYNNQVTDGRLIANLSNAESTYDATDFVSDGFILKSVVDSEHNISGGQFLYMVVYDNDSGSGKSKYPKATDTTNLSINALVPYANGIDTNGEKVSISYKNETITGLTLTQGKNYPYSKNDGTYGVNKYLPMYGALRNRSVAGENPDYFALETRKWYGTTGGEELVTNGTFDSSTTGWTAQNGATLSIVNGTLKVTSNNAFYGIAEQAINTIIGKKYKFIGKITARSNTQCGIYIETSTGNINNGVIYSTGVSASVGSYSVEFIAQTTTTYVKLVVENVAGYYAQFDDISVFETVPTIGAEITPRTYLDCVVYADQNGQVEYVEELPKIEYVDVIKANEYQGKNACTAWVNFDGTTTPPTIRDSYNVASVIRAATGTFDIYVEIPMDNTSYIVNITPYPNRIAGTSVNLNTIYKFSVETRTQAGTLENNITNNIIVFGGKN